MGASPPTANASEDNLGPVLRRPSMVMKRRPSITTIWLDDQPMKTIMEYQAHDKVEATYQKMLETGVQSAILGKHGWKQKYRRDRAPLAANYERINAPGDGPRPPLAPVAQLSLADKTPDVFTVLKHNPVRWEAKHAIVYSRLPFATLDTPPVPVMSPTIRKELSNNAVKRWQDGNFEQQIKMRMSSPDKAGEDNRRQNYGNEKLLKVANLTKKVHRASTIMKTRMMNSRTNLTASEYNLREEGAGLGERTSNNKFSFSGKGKKTCFDL